MTGDKAEKWMQKAVGNFEEWGGWNDDCGSFYIEALEHATPETVYSAMKEAVAA